MALFLIENWQLPACQEITLAAKFTETADIDGGFSVDMTVKTQQSSLAALFDWRAKDGGMTRSELGLTYPGFRASAGPFDNTWARDTSIKSVRLKDFPPLHFASICFTDLLILFSPERMCHKHSD